MKLQDSNTESYAESYATPEFAGLEEWWFKTTHWCLLWRHFSIRSRRYHLFHYSLVYTEDLHAKKKIMAPFHGWDSTIPWLQNHYEDII